MSLTLKNVLINLLYYAITLIALPSLILYAESYLGIVRHPTTILRAFSILLGLVGAFLQLWCIALFQSHGRGTPTPALAPERLVTKGPYAHVRNPMNIGEVTLFLALALWFASPILTAYAVLAALAFHLFIVTWEEPEHKRRFGKGYSAYKAGVNRWIPKPKAWSNSPDQ
ncbi:MAG: isoprenylcysteine carboxylmethyltransferase family protein [Acidobacteriota bacterium]|nr:isoprenylcysteine carboxylmethyltransferase family protein [Acidobacteriota bacterium]